MTERPNYIDYAKVLTMFLVIWGHYIPFQGMEMGDNEVWNIVHYINVFHMPLFFLVSGFLFKKKKLIDIAKRSWENLIKPYLLISLICIVLGIALHLFNNTLTVSIIVTNIIGILTGGDGLRSTMSFSGPIWFIYALVIIRILFTIVDSRRLGGGIFTPQFNNALHG